ncbi:MAG: hypothetical protein LRS46_01465 [Desulfurococcales archaeon]|nr:hypothetical protein [Desulfurococcales archaeon]
MYSPRRPRASPRVRGLVKVNSGAAGVGVGVSEALWVYNRVKAARESVRREEETLGSLVWGWAAQRRLREAKKLNSVIFADTDPATERRVVKASSIFGNLRIPVKWVRVPGPTAGQDPEALYKRLEGDGEAVKALVGSIRETVEYLDVSYIQSVQFTNSMHGSGMAINAFVAEKLAPTLLRGDYYKLMTAINADVSRIPSLLDYRKSTEWSLAKLGELLEEGMLDAVILVDNTVASAVKSVWLGLASKEDLKRAWKVLVSTENLEEGVAGFYDAMARMARLDPHEFNDLIAHAVAPLTIVPAWGMLIEGEERELRASSGPWDYYNLKRVSEGGYIVPGYLPGDQLKKVDFKAIADELAIATLAPLDPVVVRNLVVVLGEEDRVLWESQGISMYTVLEKSFLDIGYSGPLDILTLPRERGIWLYAVLDNADILKVKFQFRPWG